MELMQVRSIAGGLSPYNVLQVCTFVHIREDWRLAMQLYPEREVLAFITAFTVL
jgi:hypothetical protein